ncbi:MAG: lytic transglycosylase domain-containing protein [Anaerolineales bacterium]
MDGSFFNSQYQMILYNLIFELLDKYLSEGGVNASSDQSVSVKTGTTEPGKFADIIQKAAEKFQVDPKLIVAVIKAESNFNPQAKSPAGAIGLMQLMPGTAAGLGVQNPFDPFENINGGVKLLHRLLEKYNQNIPLALAAYNAGSGAVDQYGGVPPYPETKLYIQRVLQYYKAG